MNRVDNIINDLRKYARRNKVKITFGKNCADIDIVIDDEILSMAIGLEFEAAEVNGATHCKWRV